MFKTQKKENMEIKKHFYIKLHLNDYFWMKFTAY